MIRNSFYKVGSFIRSAEKIVEQYYLQYYNGYSCVILESLKG